MFIHNKLLLFLLVVVISKIHQRFAAVLVFARHAVAHYRDSDLYGRG